MIYYKNIKKLKKLNIHISPQLNTLIELIILKIKVNKLYRG